MLLGSIWESATSLQTIDSLIVSKSELVQWEISIIPSRKIYDKIKYFENDLQNCKKLGDSNFMSFYSTDECVQTCFRMMLDEIIYWRITVFL